MDMQERSQHQLDRVAAISVPLSLQDFPTDRISTDAVLAGIKGPSRAAFSVPWTAFPGPIRASMSLNH